MCECERNTPPPCPDCGETPPPPPPCPCSPPPPCPCSPPPCPCPCPPCVPCDPCGRPICPPCEPCTPCGPCGGPCPPCPPCVPCDPYGVPIPAEAFHHTPCPPSFDQDDVCVCVPQFSDDTCLCHRPDCPAQTYLCPCECTCMRHLTDDREAGDAYARLTTLWSSVASLLNIRSDSECRPCSDAETTEEESSEVFSLVVSRSELSEGTIGPTVDGAAPSQAAAAAFGGRTASRTTSRLSGKSGGLAGKVAIPDRPPPTVVQPESKRESVFLVIDMDCGVDSALALMLALNADNCNVLAITCTYGSVSVAEAADNVRRVLRRAKKEVPIHLGNEIPLVEPFQSLCKDCGEEGDDGPDGFGGVAWEFMVSEDAVIGQQLAHKTLICLASQFPHQITLVALGPLTNLALAQKIDPGFSRKLKELFIAGGNIDARGTVKLAAEHVFAYDPEAAFIVMKEFVCHKTIVPYQACVDSSLPWEWFDKTIMLDKMDPFVRRVTERYSRVQRYIHNLAGFVARNLFTLAIVLVPTIVEEVKQRYVTVELCGQHTRGEMLVEMRPWSTCPYPNAYVVMKINKDELSGVLSSGLF